MHVSKLHHVTKSVTLCDVNTTRQVGAPELADSLLARGIASATTSELAEMLGVPADQVRRRLHAPARRGEWVTPAQGLWIPVPPEYRLWGAPEGIELVDLLMRHLDLDYYVGWLSAAAIHGASHQAPQVFQVATSRHVRDRQVGRTRFQFLMRRASATVPTIARPTRSGTAQVSSREVTMLDVAADLDVAGGIDNAATVVIELAEDGVDEAELANLTSAFPAAAGRRIGWLLEELAGHDPLDALNAAVVGRVIEPSWLDPSGPRTGSLARRWHLRVNHEIDEEAS